MEGPSWKTGVFSNFAFGTDPVIHTWGLIHRYAPGVNPVMHTWGGGSSGAHLWADPVVHA